ncbi:N-acylethanolamine-hydrolyzing acid amidase precursor, putative [Perkinsus marinus ATCC 50983]|uniref:ceramidase n=1 Tax=Perkinsus marinus (strain ATCC 50983 / TXsc) TaxID=423536 RepID=C5LXK9_PERM5|nr:N-acylethanolamine-hydrolyzing acid amidase precursor, putative [Perkinsus marinus ATCC 50983]EEQ98531.1 N-acylethanolamine-hydrolyzing acid amidase precursor, putative [Perkinsus marinus ATCC 50983]|eukprot:XP_002765814.1 N-acylethanolamine-hydrolyzing acid amidase precursor, putative [Perkinsus marinus ATCC 50983]
MFSPLLLYILLPYAIAQDHIPTKAPYAEVDLSKRPSEHFKPAVRVALKSWPFDESFRPLFAQWNTTTFDRLSDNDYDVFMNALEKHFPVQALELRGISEEFAANGHYVSYPYLAAWAYSHEIGHFSEAPTVHHDCTALLVSDENGHVVHGRNMDQAAPDYARRVTLSLKYKSIAPGVADVETIDFYWFAGGMVTAVTTDGLSMQENWRSVNEPKEEILRRISHGAVPQSFMFREMMFAQGVRDYKGAVQFLREVPFAASVYIAVAGQGEKEGSILTRNDSSVVVPVQELGEGWYVVETNHDNWLPDPPSDPRRTKAEECIARHGQKEGEVGTFAVVLDCISEKPVLNDGTIYTAVMSPRSGLLWGRIRFDAAKITDPEALSVREILV